MQRITIEIEQSSDFQLLLLLAERIGLKIISPFRSKTDPMEREHHLKIIEKGANVPYIENPMEWQREQRKDRDLPVRD